MVYNKSKLFKTSSTDGKLALTKIGEKIYIITLCYGDLNFIDSATMSTAKTIYSNNDKFCAFAASKKFVLTASASGQIKLWDLLATKISKNLPTPIKYVVDIVLGADDSLAAFLDAKNNIHIISLSSGHKTHNFPSSGNVTTMTLYFPLKKLYLGLDTGTIIEWSLDTHKQTKYSGHFGHVTAIKFPKDIMVTCSRDKVVCIWPSKNSRFAQKPSQTFLLNEAVEDLFPVVDQIGNLSQFYFCGSVGRVRLFSLSQKRVVETSKSISSLRVLQILSLSLSDCFLENQNAEIIALTEDRVVASLKGTKHTNSFMGNIDDLEALKMIPGTKKKVVLSNNSPSLKIMDLDKNKFRVLSGHRENVSFFSVSVDGRFIFSGSCSGEIKVWDSKRRKCLFSAKGHEGKLKALCYSLPLNVVFSVGEDMWLKQWRFGEARSKEIKRVKLDKNAVSNNGFSCTKSIKISGSSVNCMGVSFNGSVVACGSMDSLIKVWKLPSFGEPHSLTGHKKAVWDLKFCENERIMASSSSDKTVKIWSLSSLSCLKTFEGHNRTVYGSVFLKSRGEIASFGDDQKVSIWKFHQSTNIDLGKESSITPGHNINSLCVASDDSLIIAGENSISLWKNNLRLDGSVDEFGIPRKVLGSYAQTKMLRKEQFNLLTKKGDFKEAFAFSCESNSPAMLRRLLESGQFNEKEFVETLEPLSANGLRNLLLICANWVSSHKTAVMAQILLSFVFVAHSRSKIAHSVGEKTLLSLGLFSGRALERGKKLLRDVRYLSIFESL